MASEVELLKDATQPQLGFKMVTQEEAAFYNGQAYVFADYTTGLAASGVLDFLFDPTACTCDKLVISLPQFNATAGPVTVELYSFVTVTANGTEQVTFNRAAVPTVAEAKIYLGPTIDSLGDRIAGYLVPGTSGFLSSSAGEAPGMFEFELSPLFKVLVRATNLDATAIDIGYQVTWAELFL